MVFGNSSLHILHTGQFTWAWVRRRDLSLRDGLGGGVISSPKALDRHLGSPAWCQVTDFVWV